MSNIKKERIDNSKLLVNLAYLRTEYASQNILLGIIINLILVYLVLKLSGWIEKKIGRGGEAILRKVFGIVLLAISIKLFKTNLLSM